MSFDSIDKLHGLYAITDSTLLANNLVNGVLQVIQAGCQLIQYRDKSSDQEKRLRDATALAELCKKNKTILIINDDIELCLAVDADGVHLGQDDCGLAQARQRLGENKIIGISCYNSLELASKAVQQQADYIAFGSFFDSSIKPNALKAQPELIQQAKAKLGLPIAAIGGITHSNAAKLIEQGADMIAVISQIFQSPNIKKSAQQFTDLFKGSYGTGTCRQNKSH